MKGQLLGKGSRSQVSKPATFGWIVFIVLSAGVGVALFDGFGAVLGALHVFGLVVEEPVAAD